MLPKVTNSKHNKRSSSRWKQPKVGHKVWRILWVMCVLLILFVVLQALCRHFMITITPHMIARCLGVICVSLLLFTVLQVVVYKFVIPPITPHMITRYFQQRKDSGRQVRFERKYVPIDDISSNLIDATLIAEDWLFVYHHGFLFNELCRAYSRNKQDSGLRGGSTISQQTAKNCFLPFSRTLLRKAVEAYYTFLIEKIWGKKRIMECYLNVIEFGDGIYGCEAACRHFFHHSSKSVSVEEAVLLAALLSSPLTADPYHHTDLYDARIAHIKKHIYNQPPTVWNQKREDMDPERLARSEHGLIFFIKWWCLQKLKR